MNANLSTLLLKAGQFAIPAGAEGRRLVESMDHAVPRRSEGRTKQHRERFCFVALLKTLMTIDAGCFPARVHRGESPDFLLICGNGRVCAIEHTDAGEKEYQRHLAGNEDATESVFIPSPNGDGWAGDLPERRFDSALMAALAKKSSASVWRNAPNGAERWLLMYDQTNTRMFISHGQALERLGAVATAADREGNAYHRIFLVRDQEQVLHWPERKEVP
jgi:hypothetical protein